MSFRDSMSLVSTPVSIVSCIDNNNIYRSDLDLVLLRAQIGMVFQKPNPFLKSIYENVSQTTGVNIVGYFKGFIPTPKDFLKKDK